MTRSQTATAAFNALSEEGMRERLALAFPDAAAAVARMASGNVQRNDAVVLKAAMFAVEMLMAKPKQQLEVDARTSISVIDPYAEQPKALPASQQTLMLAPAVKAAPPIVRKKQAPPGGDPGIRPGARGDLDADKMLGSSSGSPVVQSSGGDQP